MTTKRVCKCTFAQKMVGDGCDVCNPSHALAKAGETIGELQAENDALQAENDRLKAYPMQPLYKDKDGIVRFKANTIVAYLLDNGGIDMNKLASLDFSAEDREQFAQLIGYSLRGFGELSYVTDETYSAAEARTKS